MHSRPGSPSRRKSQPFLTALRTETDRMSGVMRSLLEYGRPVSDERQRVAIDLVLREAVQLCQRDALAKGVALDIRTEDGLPEVAIDHSRVLEVFRNLVENGIQHSPGGGSVTLEARPRKSRPGWMEVLRDGLGLRLSRGRPPEGLRTILLPSPRWDGAGAVDSAPRRLRPRWEGSRGHRARGWRSRDGGDSAVSGVPA